MVCRSHPTYWTHPAHGGALQSTLRQQTASAWPVSSPSQCCCLCVARRSEYNDAFSHDRHSHTCQVKAAQIGHTLQCVGNSNGARLAKVIVCRKIPRETMHAWNTLSQHIGFNSLECRRTCNIQLAKFHQMAECTRKCCSTIVLDVVLCHTRLRETTKARGGLNCRHRTYATNKALAVLSHAPTAWQVPWLLQHQGCSLTLEKPRKDGCYRPGCPTTPTERRVPGMSNSRSAAICATHFIMDVHPSGPMLVAVQLGVSPRCMQLG